MGRRGRDAAQINALHPEGVRRAKHRADIVQRTHIVKYHHQRQFFHRLEFLRTEAVHLCYLQFDVQRYAFLFTSRLISVENLSIATGKIFIISACNLHNSCYTAGGMNPPKKLATKYDLIINLFFSPNCTVHNPKVINFAAYRQGVNSVRLWKETGICIKTLRKQLGVDNHRVTPRPETITSCARNCPGNYPHY